MRSIFGAAKKIFSVITNEQIVYSFYVILEVFHNKVATRDLSGDSKNKTGLSKK